MGATTAKRVFGHKGNFTEGVNGYECNNSFLSVPPTPDTLCYPSSLGLDNGGDLFVGDLNNNRVLEFNYPLAKTGKPGSGDTTADRVYGQNNSFTTSSCNSGGFTTDAGSLCNPLAVAVASNNTVFIADGANERVLAYDPLTTPTSTPSATASPFLTPIPTEKATATHRPSPAPTATSTRTPITSRTSTPTPTRTHTATPTPTPRECIASTPKPTVPVPTPTPLPGHPRIASVSSPVLAGASFTIKGSGFTKGSVVNFFVATPKGPVNEGPLSPDPKTLTGTQLVIPVPKTITLGEGFAAVVVINTDKAFVGSNPAFALLQGSTAAGLPSITELNGHPLASTSLDPDYAVDNVETTLLQGSKVVINGNGFDTVHGAAVDVFCACTGGKLPTMFLTPGNPNLKSNSISFTLPTTAPTGPGSIIVSNAAGGSYSAKSNAVSVPLGTRITVTGEMQSKNTLTVEGTGFSTLTVINFFNAQGASVGQPGRAEVRRRRAHSDHPDQLDQVQLCGTERSNPRTGLRAGAQPTVPGFYQQRQ